MEFNPQIINITPKNQMNPPNLLFTNQLQQQLQPDQNYLCYESGVKAFYALSNNQFKDISQSILTSDQNKLWLSSDKQSFPHTIVVDLTSLENRPRYFRFFGFHCWHAYNSNPAQIKVLISQDGRNFVYWQTFNPTLKAGKQVFKLKNKIGGNDLNFMKIEIAKCHGNQNDKVYVNQVMLFETYQEQYQSTNQRSNASSAASSNYIIDDNTSQITGNTVLNHLYPQFNNPTSQIRTIETQYEIDQPLSYQNSVDSSSSYFLAQEDQTVLHHKNDPFQRKLTNMVNELDSLQQQSFDSFQAIKQLKQSIAGQPESAQKNDIQLFLNGLQNGYQQIQTQMSILNEKINNMYQTVQYTQSQFHNQYSHFQSQSNIQQQQQQQHQQSTHNLEQNTHNRFVEQQNLNGTSTFRNRAENNNNNLQDKNQLVQQCVLQCQQYIMTEFQKMMNDQSRMQIETPDNNKENQPINTQIRSQRLEKSLEQRIDKYISSQQKQPPHQQQLQEIQNLIIPNTQTQQVTQRAIATPSTSQHDVQKIAQELQMKLAIKAKKLQELQDREESKMTDSSRGGSCQDSDESSVISNCSSLLKMQRNVNDHRHPNIQMPKTIQNLSKVFQYNENFNDVNLLNDEDDENEEMESQIERYFISSNRDEDEDDN